MGFIAAGRPTKLFAPDDALLARDEVATLDFMEFIFGVVSHERTRAEVTDEAMTRHAAALAHHAEDVGIAPGPTRTTGMPMPLPLRATGIMRR